ncbi:MAG: IS66 family transposase [Cyanobacteria bacterium J06627_28]
MEKLPDLSGLSSEAKDALIIALWEEVQRLRQRLDDLEKPKKTSQNSSIPPSKGFKANKKPSKRKKGGERRAASIGRAGGGRKLKLHPDETVVAQLECCPGCAASMPRDAQRLHSRYDRIELPKITPIVTRVERYKGTCRTCGIESIASVPEQLAPGSPFGQSIESLVTHLRYGHAISYERLHQLLGEVFNLSISEGALANLLTRVKERLAVPLAEILSHLRQAEMICSDETSARVNGKNQWEWVFQNPEVCFHIIFATRGGSAIYAVLEDHEPEVWVSDLFGAQANHPAKQWQVCLAHQLRDCQYAIDAGDTIFAGEMKALFKRALDIHHRRLDLAETTRYQYRLGIKRRLRRILALEPDQADGIRLKKRYEGITGNLFLFLEDASIPPTNNSSEQAIRMSTLFRKVTNGFRSDWGKDLFAAVRSVVNTGKRQGLSALQSIQTVLSGRSLFQPG